VNVSVFERFAAGATITPETLREAGILKHLREPVKVLGQGELSKKLTISAHRFSEAAKAKIEAAGGTAVVIGPETDEAKDS
jgi:large subunit ribosomal protein L15